MREAMNRNDFGTNESVDDLVMSSSKLVETSLKEEVELSLGVNVGARATAINVLDLAVGRGLVANRDDPLYHFLFWYFKERRNPPHHTFPSYDVHELLDFIVATEEALDNVEALAAGSVGSKFRLDNDLGQRRYTITVDEISRGGVPFQDATAEVMVTNPDRTFRNIPLVFDQGRWAGIIDYRGWATGSYSLRVRGRDSNGVLFTSSSGSTFNLSARTCSNCNANIGMFSFVCQNCGLPTAGSSP